MSGVCRRHERRKMDKKFWCENLKERDHSEDSGVDRNSVETCGLDASVSR